MVLISMWDSVLRLQARMPRIRKDFATAKSSPNLAARALSISEFNLKSFRGITKFVTLSRQYQLLRDDE